MKRASLGWLSALTLISAVLWLALLIAGMAGAGPLDTFERVLVHYASQDPLQALGYYNSALVTVLVTALMAGLYLYTRQAAPGWGLVGLVFVPVYCVLNLLVYLSQVTLVPQLLALHEQPEYRAAAGALLSQSLQLWPGAFAYFANGLAYAILGLPSIVFGLLLTQAGGLLRLAGALLALNGVACILGLAGILAGNSLLAQGSVAGGALFILALIPLCAAMLRVPLLEQNHPNPAH